MADTDTDDPTARLFYPETPPPGAAPGQSGLPTAYAPEDQASLPEILRKDPRDLTAYDPESEDREPPGARDPEERRLAEVKPTSDTYGPGDPRTSRAMGAVDYAGEHNEMMDRWRAGQDRMRKLQEGQERATGPLYDEAIAATRQPRPEVPQLQHQPIPVDRTFNMRDYVVPAMMAAVFGSLISRQHVTGALNSFSGFMEGARQGNLDQAKLKLEDWKAQSQAVVEENRTMMDQYNAILKNQNMDMTQKMNAVRLTAEKWQDQMRAQAAENHDIVTMSKSLDALHFHNEQMAAKNRQIDIQGARLDAMKEGASGAPMSDKAKEVIADMFMETGKLPPNIWRGKAGRADAIAVMDLVAEKAAAAGQTGTDLARTMQRFAAESAALSGAARTAGGQAAKVGAAVAETETTIPLAREAMKNLATKIQLGDYPTVNAGRMFKAHQMGVEELRMAHNANEAVITAYGSVMGRGNVQLTNLARTRADALLQIVEGPKVYNASLKQLMLEMDAAKDAPEESIRRLLERATKRKSSAATEDEELKKKIRKSLGFD